MKRLLAMVSVCLLLAGVLCLPASAESAASRVDMLCTVNPDGDCQVSMTVTLRLEAMLNTLTFPLPLEAKNITANGAPVSATRSNSTVDVDISRIVQGYVGEATIRFDYTLPKAVGLIPPPGNTETAQQAALRKKQLQLTLPMLSGFDYPVESLNFTVTMPVSSTDFSPEFTSTYRQSSVRSDLEVLTRGSQITGSSRAILQDHDGIVMTMRVPREMFPTVSTYVREGNPETVPMGIFAALALVYWLLFLRCAPLRRERTSTPPEGITAGELGCCLTLTGGDLTAMVFTWAQLGYILIQLDGNGRVLLHKRMDMGNERSAYENKAFRMLFGSRRTVDGTGYQYAAVAQKVSQLVSGEKNMLKTSSGNQKIFRWLACGSGVFCGICVAMNMSAVPFLQVLLSVILAVLGAVSAWLLQGVAYRTHLRGKLPVFVGLGALLLWIVLGLLCGQVVIPLLASLGQLVLGFFAAYGGRRSDLGRHDASMVLGLRQYVRHLPRNDVGRLLANDPDYFFRMAPYALALGSLRPFADAFGRRKMDQCPYLVTRVHGKRTAQEWAELMAGAADMMDAKFRQLRLANAMSPAALPVLRPAPPKRRRKRS